MVKKFEVSIFYLFICTNKWILLMKLIVSFSLKQRKWDVFALTQQAIELDGSNWYVTPKVWKSKNNDLSYIFSKKFVF